MSPEIIGSICIAGLLLLVLLRCPVALTMILIGVAGFAAINGPGPALAVLRTSAADVATNHAFTMIPLFLLMGNLAAQAGLSADLFSAARTVTRGWRGGLPLAAMTASAGFSAVSGSSVATAATMARVAMPELTRAGYSQSLAAGSLAAGGTLGIMIPPSIALLLYALITGQSVGMMFLAGLGPGLLAWFLYLLTIAVWVRIRPHAAQDDAPPGGLLRAARQAAPVATLFVLVMGGLYGNLFTPTEAAGAGAFLALIVALIRRTGRARLTAAFVDTARTSAAIFLIIIGAEVFGFLLSVSQIPFALSELSTRLDLSPAMILALILVFYVLLGCVMESLAMILLTVPIFYPLVIAAGFDPVWFGVIAVMAVEFGLITPPVGMNLFVIKGVSPATPMRDIMRGALPFIGADLIRLALIVALPGIALTLPRLAGY